MEPAKNLTGIDEPGKIAAFFQKAGIPFESVIAGGTITNFRIEHIWVEAEIPYSNYRGAIIDEHGKTWLGLDTSLKVTGYTYNSPPDIFQQSGGSDLLSALRDDYLGAMQAETPLEFTRTKIEAFLAENDPGTTYQDLLRSRTLIPEVLNILPASLQFTQTRITHEYTSIPDALLHQVVFTALDTSGAQLFTVTLPAYSLSNRKVVLTFEPETVEDQEIINASGGLDNTPSYLVRLRPVLKVNDQRTIVGQAGLPMGAEFRLKLELVSPNGTETIENTRIMGNISALGIVSQKPSLLGGEGQGEGGKDAGTLLYEEAIRYINRWNQAEDELASLMHLAITRPIPTVVTVGGVLDVTYLLNTPHDLDWRGVFVDADLRAIETIPASPLSLRGDRGGLFMQLSSLQGSILENRIFEDDFGVGSISTAKFMQISSESGEQLLTIDQTNIDTLLPAVPFAENIIEEIQNAVNQGLAVTIPATETTFEDWTGTGYIKEDLLTGASGWMLSGMIAGGMTAVSSDRWPETYAEAFRHVFSQKPNEDPASARYVYKGKDIDWEQGTAGETFPRPLEVHVYDSEYRPVKGADVTFTIKAGGGKFADGSSSTSVKTDGLGIARVELILGEKTSDNPVFIEDPDGPSRQQVGSNIVDAALSSGIHLEAPFTVYGAPGDPAKLRKLYGDDLSAPILFMSGFVSVVVEDDLGNPIANQPVDFEMVSPLEDPSPGYLIKTDEACIWSLPFYGQCGDTADTHLSLLTSAQGAQAQVMLGGASGQYIISATSGELSETFIHTSAYDPDARGTYMYYTYPSDINGFIISAGLVDTEIPVMVKFFYVLEGVGGPEIHPYSSVGDPDVWVTFDGTPGKYQGNGLYTYNHKLTPGLNWVHVEGMPGMERLDIPAWGVEIPTDPVSPILVDETGFTVQDTEIRYTINPTGHGDFQDYWAGTAYVLILKDGDPVTSISTETHGQGLATLANGFWFDVNAEYKAQVVLNYGTGAEMRGEEVPLPLAQLQIVTNDDNETPMTGAVTDGAALLRLKLTATNWQALPALTWSLLDSQLTNTAPETKGTLLNGDNPVASLPVIFDAEGVARAVYRAPDSFVRWGAGESIEAQDKEGTERQVQITLNGQAVSSPSLLLKRPPVVLVHGTWGTPNGTWREFNPIVDGDGEKYFIIFADYSKPPFSNVGSLDQNYPAIPIAIIKALDAVKEEKLSGTKVDVITHSLGGLVTREYCRREGTACSESIRKIITLDTPHLGTELAQVWQDHHALISFIDFLRKIAHAFGSEYPEIDGPALEEQVPGSSALITLAQSSLTVPLHKIVGKTPDLTLAYVRATREMWEKLGFWFNLVPDESFPLQETMTTVEGDTLVINYEPVFLSSGDPDGGRNDRIVSMRSQKNGEEENTTVFENVDHVTIHGDSMVPIDPNVVDCIKQLLDARETDTVWTQGCSH